MSYISNKTTMKNILTIGALLATAYSSAAATLFFDDFEAETAGQSQITLTNWVWNGNGSVNGNHSRIFDTVNYGGTRLWIANGANADLGTGLNSTATITLAAGEDHVFSAALVMETFNQNRTGTGTVDLLIGGSSLIGGPQAFTAMGDDTVPDSYDDQRTEIPFNSGAGGNLEIKIAYDGTSDGAFVGIDEVEIRTVDLVPEPSSTALLGLGGLALMLRRRK